MSSRILRQCIVCKTSKRTTTKKENFVCKKCRNFTKKFFSQIRGVENSLTSFNIFHLQIMLKMADENSILFKQISSDLMIPKSSAYRYISQLHDGGFIEKVDMVYSLSKKGKKIILNFNRRDLKQAILRKSYDKPLRFHYLQGKFNVENPPLEYQRYFDRNQPEYYNKVIRIPVGRNKRMKGFKLEISSCIIVFYSPWSIAVTFPDILVCSDNEIYVAEGYCKLGTIIDTVVEKLEDMFRGLKIDSFCPFGITNQHIAIKDSKYAKKYHEKNKTRLNENDKIITDKSNGHHELEAVDPKTAGYDINECIKREKEAEEDKDAEKT